MARHIAIEFDSQSKNCPAVFSLVLYFAVPFLGAGGRGGGGGWGVRGLVFSVSERWRWEEICRRHQLRAVTVASVQFHSLSIFN